MENLELGQLHPLLKVNVYSSRDVIRLPAKLKLMCGSLQTNRQKFNNSQVDPTCLLCQRDHETLEHYILRCSALDSIRLPILQHISISYYENLTGNIFQDLDNASKLQIIIDCSVLISQEKSNKRNIRIQDLSELEFHARRLTHVLPVNRYKLLDKDAS